MDWKGYEKAIEEYFKKIYPNCNVSHDVKIVGRYSKVERQVDLLIEASIADNEFKICIDAKYFSKPIDVKHVELIIGMLDDLGADKGIIITSKGYSQAALNRAYYDPRRLELDVFNLDELLHYQGFGAFTYDGQFGAYISSPIGWIIDGRKREGSHTCLYQRGLTFEQANKRFEFIYIKIVAKVESEHSSLNDLLDYQSVYTMKNYPDAQIILKEVPWRNKERVVLRTITSSHLPTTEYTSFIDFEDFIFFAVMYTPETVLEGNMKKLKYLTSTAIPVITNFKNKTESAIFHLRGLIDRTTITEEKKYLLSELKEILLSINDENGAQKVIQQLKELES